VKPLRIRRPASALSLLLAALVAGCGTAPVPYARPVLEMPAAWTVQAPWRESAPNDRLPRGPWWERFGDARLNALQQQALGGNPSLAIAAARLAQARALMGAAGASQGPQVSTGARVARQRISANRPLSRYDSPNFSTVQDDYTLSLQVAYEVDLWGRVQSVVDASQASAEQIAADLENVRLVLSTDLAAAYFNLRQTDIELDVLAKSIALQRRALGLARARHELGATSGLDVAQQQALLDNTLVQVDVLRRQRDQFEHALATLVGVPAPQFSLAAELAPRSAPAIPIGLPSDLLERRPDVASAERAVALANAQVGIARAAYYPSVTLAPNFGLDSRMLSTLFDAPSMLWSLGVQLAAPLFDGGRADANVAAARASHEATVANYRRVVLVAMQEVEDGISSSAALDRALAQAQTAVASAERVLQLATSRYEGGVATYLDVVSAQQALLNSQRQAAQLLGQRLLVAVFLIKALGGGWQAA
jgi:multidrug efflux system outer membrane protein